MRVRIARAPVLNWLMRSYRNLLQMAVDRRPDDSKEILTVPCDVRRGRLAVVHRTAACI
jgi:adenylate cyclase